MPNRTPLHMSPAQAAHVAGVSRWTIMRAIKSHELQATRDNRNQWKITSDALDAWRASTVRTPDAPHTSHTSIEAINLHQQLAEQTSRATIAEALLIHERSLNADLKADRDHWRQQATALLKQPPKRHRWWPW